MSNNTQPQPSVTTEEEKKVPNEEYSFDGMMKHLSQIQEYFGGLSDTKCADTVVQLETNLKLVISQLQFEKKKSAKAKKNSAHNRRQSMDYKQGFNEQYRKSMDLKEKNRLLECRIGSLTIKLSRANGLIAKLEKKIFNYNPDDPYAKDSLARLTEDHSSDSD